MRKSKYTRELLEPIVANSLSTSAVLAQLGLRNTGGNYKYIQAKIKLLNLDTSHFTKQAWAKGLTADTDSRVRRTGFTDDEVFVKHSPVGGMSGDRLKSRLIRKGFQYVCQECGLTHWRGEQMTLHVDHIDGDNTNNELSNLRFLCPNCHQLTNTWGNNRNKKKAA